MNVDRLTYLVGRALDGILAAQAERTSPVLAPQVADLALNFGLETLHRVDLARLEYCGQGEALEKELHAALGEQTRLGGLINALAQHILEKCPGEPSRSEGAVETACRLLDQYRAERDAEITELATTRRALGVVAAERDLARRTIDQMKADIRAADDARVDADGRAEAALRERDEWKTKYEALSHNAEEHASQQQPGWQ